jgi:hypothetical protein
METAIAGCTLNKKTVNINKAAESNAQQVF